MFSRCFGKKADTSDEEFNTDKTNVPKKLSNKLNKSNEPDKADATWVSSHEDRVTLYDPEQTKYTIKRYASPARPHEVSLPTTSEISDKDIRASRKSLFRKSLMPFTGTTPGTPINIIIPLATPTKEADTHSKRDISATTAKERSISTQTVTPTKQRRSTSPSLKAKPRNFLKQLDTISPESSSSSTISYVSETAIEIKRKSEVLGNESHDSLVSLSPEPSRIKRQSAITTNTRRFTFNFKLPQEEKYLHEKEFKKVIEESESESEQEQQQQQQQYKQQQEQEQQYKQQQEQEQQQQPQPQKNDEFLPNSTMESNRVQLAVLPKIIREMANPQEKQISTTLEEILYFRQECLEMHNKCREKHNVQPLTLSMKMCNYAQEWAYYMAESGLLEHKNNNEYGTNLFKASGTTFTAESIVQHWYDEIHQYNFTKPGLTAQSGHFTQIVWADTKFLGVGMKKRDRHTWVVCIYDPPGNIIGNFEGNVLPPYKKRPDEELMKAEIRLTNDDFAKACLEVHNKYRARHGCPPLTLSNHMNEYATEWAQQLAKFGFLRHRPNNKYGENLFLATNYTPSAEEVVKDWYEECHVYDYKNPNFTDETGNFTQIVWKDSTDLGVGFAKMRQSTYVVCNYAPHGNVLERFQANVPLPVTQETEASDSSSEDSLGRKNSDFYQGYMPNLKFSLFEEECLAGHNRYRALHGCPPLVLNRKLCNYAQDWAEYLAKIHSLEHRPNPKYGENLFYANFKVSGEDPVKDWYGEVKDYNFQRPGFHSTTGHFTQVIWKKTKELGVGKSEHGNFTFVVCNYEPFGNIINHFENNVPALLEPTPKEKRSTLRRFTTSLLREPRISIRADNIPVNMGVAFEEQCLKSHNKYRTLHGCPPLQINKAMNAYAMEWAKYLCKNNKIERRPNRRYGENLYYGSGFRVNGSDAVVTWYNEINNYDFKNPRFSSETGHFTQLIWRNSRELGVAAINSGDSTYVVCNYSPPGNVIGQFEHNVPQTYVKRSDDKEEKKKHDHRKLTANIQNLDSNTFADQVLKKHNFYRAKHNTPPVKLSDKLNDFATEWANHLAENNMLKNRPGNLYGENLFKATGWDITADELMSYWYNDVKTYKFDQPQPSAFTQIVWKKTKNIGVGLAKRNDSIWIVVNYEPPGNYTNQYKDNVLQAMNEK